MTLTQLKFVLTVEKTKSINAAAKLLYISQSTVSEGIRDLENELGITIYSRSNRGIELTKEGEDFVQYARNVMIQYDLLLEHYNNPEHAMKDSFCVTIQHSMVAAGIFAQLVQEFGLRDYEYSIMEASTSKVIDDVKNYRSEIGLVYMSQYNENIYNRLFQREGLRFELIGEGGLSVYVSSKHPLATKEIVTYEELAEYPCLIYEQDNNSSFYFYEEIISETYLKGNVIRTYDRGTQLDLLMHMDSYSIGTANVASNILPDWIKRVPIDTDEVIRVGYITRTGAGLSTPGEAFISKIKAVLK